MHLGRKLMVVIMSILSLRPKISMVLLISSMILRRESMHLRLRSRQGTPIIEVTIGQTRLNLMDLLMVQLQQDQKMLKMSSIQLMEIRKKRQKLLKCIEKLMAILVLVNKKLETIIGIEQVQKSQTIDLAMENKKFLMELQSQFIMRDLIKVSLKQLLSRRLLKIKKL